MFTYRLVDHLIIPIYRTELYFLRADIWRWRLDWFDFRVAILFGLSAVLCAKTNYFWPLISINLMINASGFLCLGILRHYNIKIERELNKLAFYSMYYSVLIKQTLHDV